MTVNHRSDTAVNGYGVRAMTVEPSPGTAVSGEHVNALAERVSARLRGGRIWHVNSTATGGGVVELLHGSIGRHGLLRLPATWLVSNASPDYFTLTKRIHHGLHGRLSNGLFTADDVELYHREGERQARRLLGHVGAGDLVMLHDPQLLATAPALLSAGAGVIWRSHIGTDHATEATAATWRLLRPYAEVLGHLVFTMPRYVPEFLPAERVAIVRPSIDPYAAKNREIPAATRAVLLGRIGLTAPPPGDAPAFEAVSLGRTVHVRALPEEVPVVMQVSRWDPLKDMTGVLRTFTEHIAPFTSAHLVLAGPDPADIPDDPEGLAVYHEVLQARDDTPGPVRERIHLVMLSLRDFEANALVVNALQRRADVIVQKSLEEGFGLTVTEAMWKRRPIVASGVGGITAQITSGEQGILIEDPRDLDAFGRSVVRLLDDQAYAGRLGEAARSRARSEFLSDRELADTLRLYLTALEG